MQKNLNDIIPPSRRRAMEGSEDAPAYTSSPVPPPPPERPSYARPLPPRSKRSFPVGTAIVAAIIILGSIGALFAFSGAEVNVTATENQTAVAGEFLATGSAGDLPFEILTVEKVASVDVESEGTETVNQSAQGTLTIENKQTVPQQLIKNTRFETPDGLIFRIRDSVTVPASKGGAPGTLVTTVYADAAGENYNVGPTTFTLPGLKGGATFTQVTARSTEAMKGGFAGTRPSVKAATRDAKAQEIRTKLGSDIDAAIAEAVPEGYILVPGASRVTYEPQPDQAGAKNSVQISEKAIANIVVFPKAALARSIAYQVVGSYSGQPISIEDASGLTLTPVGDLPVPGIDEFAFSLAGNTKVLWSVDPAKIASAVAGKSSAQAETVLAGYPEVERATFVLRPFWNRSFPADPAKIKVSVENAPKAK
ncbi:MAG: hypothetical protein Q8S35_01045 [bacterium]|nr:hypothetical protein [bacterium]